MLSENSKKLLREACNDPNAAIIKVSSFDGLSVSTNGKEFAELKNPRSEALWKNIVEELEEEDLIEDRAGKEELYFVTNEGFMLCDELSDK